MQATTVAVSHQNAVPSPQQMRAFELGKKHRALLDGEEVGIGFYQSLPSDELDFVAYIEERAPVSRGFYLSALKGAEMPKRGTGVRYGKAPGAGVSRNHVDDRGEVGVSMSSVDGVDYKWAPMGIAGKPVRYEGWLLDPEVFWGSDGEPLMLGLKEIESAE